MSCKVFAIWWQYYWCEKVEHTSRNNRTRQDSLWLQRSVFLRRFHAWHTVFSERAVNVTLLHEGADAEPETVDERELVLDDVAVGVARVRVVPLVRTESGQHEQRQTHHHVRRQHVDPHLQQWYFPLTTTIEWKENKWCRTYQTSTRATLQGAATWRISLRHIDTRPDWPILVTFFCSSDVDFGPKWIGVIY